MVNPGHVRKAFPWDFFINKSTALCQTLSERNLITFFQRNTKRMGDGLPPSTCQLVHVISAAMQRIIYPECCVNALELILRLDSEN